jgi:hypothetical protein
VSRQWFDNSGGVRRMDWTILPILTIEFVPPSTWFRGVNTLEQENTRKFLGGPVIDLQVSFARVDSSQPGIPYRQWQIGPMLKTAWKF